MKGVSKHFGGFAANDDVDFELEKGEIHALLGENGAGKTTLMNVLYGLYHPTRGEILVNGERVSFTSPSVAIEHGIGMVHQHFMLIPQLTVAQNIFLGMPKTGFFFNAAAKAERVRELDDLYGFHIDPNAGVWQLSVGTQQKVEILKALVRDIKVLILDEPTAVLTPQEVDTLFSSLKSMTREGYSIILITHRMEEVMTYCDRVTVMRSGKVVSTENIRDVNEVKLANMMIGRDVLLEIEKEESNPGKSILELQNVFVRRDDGLDAVRDVTFQVREGEIVGIAGVDGNGQLELGEAIAGLRKLESGILAMGGHPVLMPTTGKMMERGLGYIPDDRQKKGLVLPFSIKENILLGAQKDPVYCVHNFIDYRQVTCRATDLANAFDVRYQSIDQKVGDLSGGNQQKVILARVFSRDPKLILAIQPTRGLDIGAIEFVRQQLVDARAQGKSVLLISTDLDEIMSLSDRILVMFNGGLSASYARSEITGTQIGLLMSGKDAAAGEASAGEEAVGA